MARLLTQPMAGTAIGIVPEGRRPASAQITLAVEVEECATALTLRTAPLTVRPSSSKFRRLALIGSSAALLGFRDFAPTSPSDNLRGRMWSGGDGRDWRRDFEPYTGRSERPDRRRPAPAASRRATAGRWRASSMASRQMPPGAPRLAAGGQGRPLSRCSTILANAGSSPRKLIARVLWLETWCNGCICSRAELPRWGPCGERAVSRA